MSHDAPTPPCCPVTIEVDLAAVDGRQLTFAVQARDDAAVISPTHRRAIITTQRFSDRLHGRAGGARP